MISNASKSAVKSMVYLASKRIDQEKQTIKTIAREVGENEHTIGKILQLLAKNGLISSVKGPNGGFYLNEVQTKLTLYDIVETIDGRNSLHKCGLGLNSCSSRHPCPIHDEYKIARDIMENLLRANTIQDISKSYSNGLTFLNA